MPMPQQSDPIGEQSKPQETIPFSLESSPKEGSSLFHRCQLPYNMFHNTLPQNFITGSVQQPWLCTTGKS